MTAARFERSRDALVKDFTEVLTEADALLKQATKESGEKASDLRAQVETKLRAALYQAVADAGDQGLDYTELAPRVQLALNLPMSDYAQNPEAKYGPKEEIDRALREVLAYRLYVDLRAGWRRRDD